MPIGLSPAVKVAGQALNALWLGSILEIKVEREFQLPGRVTLRFADEGYELAETGLMTLGAELLVIDPSGSPNLITAEITSISVEQRPGQQPDLVVVGHDKSHRLGRATRLKSYLSMSYSDVATSLAADAGLTAEVDSLSNQVDYVMQVDSDQGLLTELARRVGYDWWVDGTTLYFKKPAAGTQVRLTLGDDLKTFSVRASGHHPDVVTVDGWDRSQQQLVTGTASSASTGVASSSEFANLVATPSSAFGSATLLTVGIAAQSQTEATQLSQAIYDRAQSCAVTARGLTDGTGSIALGSTVVVSGAGPLSGSYPVTQVEHYYGPSTGYVTRFVAGDRRPTSLVDTLARGPSYGLPAHRQLGLTVGQVTNINDPNSTGRVKVRYPGASENDETGWARVVSVGGGVNRGTVFLPEVNDEVLVGFEGGDPRQPVVIGGLYGARSTIPSPNIQDGKVATRAFTSRLGHVINLLDGTEEAQQAIELSLAGGQHKVHLGKDQLNISVPAALPVNIVAGDSSVKFGQDGAITVSGPNVTIQATAELKLSAPTITVSADSALSLQGQANASLKGASIQVQAQTALVVAGEPVMIN